MSAAPRGLSRPHASFIGTVCQGIHHCALHHGPHHPQNRGARRATTEHNERHEQHRVHWNTRLSDHHTHQPHTHKGTGPTRNKRTNTRDTPTTGNAPCSKIAIRTTNHTPTTKGGRGRRSRPLSSSQTTTTPDPHDRTHTGPAAGPGRTGATTPTRGALAVRGPNSMHHTTHPRRDALLISSTPARGTPGHQGTGNHSPTRTPTTGHPTKLRRKEVIQPHLPVRLPCYDLVPITSLTLDGSPRKSGWATGFGCCPLS